MKVIEFKAALALLALLTASSLCFFSAGKSSEQIKYKEELDSIKKDLEEVKKKVGS